MRGEGLGTRLGGARGGPGNKARWCAGRAWEQG